VNVWPAVTPIVKSGDPAADGQNLGDNLTFTVPTCSPSKSEKKLDPRSDLLDMLAVENEKKLDPRSDPRHDPRQTPGTMWSTSSAS
jgi:hypothetical protein